jgi:hypothetical protein
MLYPGLVCRTVASRRFTGQTLRKGRQGIVLDVVERFEPASAFDGPAHGTDGGLRLPEHVRECFGGRRGGSFDFQCSTDGAIASARTAGSSPGASASEAASRDRPLARTERATAFARSVAASGYSVATGAIGHS